MKLSALLLLPFFAAVLANLAVVCPHGVHSNCCPQVFQPFNEWQVIQEGQQIPAGLHVRLNLKTGEQEARLLQPEDAESAEWALINENEKPHEYTSYNHLRAKKKSRLVESDLSDYTSSVAEVLAFDKNTGDYVRLITALNTLIELSHDIDFGVQLATNSRTFFRMVNIAESANNDEVAEKIFRIMAASLRNNPEATELFLEHHQGRLLPQIFEILQDSKTSNLVQKRILGMVHALALDSEYASCNMNLGNATTAHDFFTLISLFPNLGNAAKDMIALILEDLHLIDKFDYPTESAEEAFSEFLQVFLYSDSATSEPQFQSAYRTLAQLHQKESLPLKKEFTLWISKEAEERRSGIKQRSKIYSKEDLEFDSFVAQTRHLIFGNPNAVRKQGDEL